jgi:hypothetical protein
MREEVPNNGRAITAPAAPWSKDLRDSGVVNDFMNI